MAKRKIARTRPSTKKAKPPHRVARSEQQESSRPTAEPAEPAPQPSRPFPAIVIGGDETPEVAGEPSEMARALAYRFRPITLSLDQFAEMVGYEVNPLDFAAGAMERFAQQVDDVAEAWCSKNYDVWQSFQTVIERMRVTARVVRLLDREMKQTAVDAAAHAGEVSS